MMNRKWSHGRFVAPLKISSSNNSQDSAPNIADEQSFVIEMILFFKKCAVLIALVVIFPLLPCPEKRRDERRNSKDSAAPPDSACSKPQLSKKCIFRILIILTWVLEHAPREKILSMVSFLIFVHKNVYRIRFQVIKIGSWEGFEKIEFFSLFLMRKQLSSGQNWFLRPHFFLIRGMFAF